ncbi:hypothetical protein K8I28_14705 [bacterium]|nr:hypothetical protein [bacterium]
MASWGNNDETQYEQDMNSNGYKLTVSHGSANTAVDVSNTGSGKGLSVTGQTELTHNNATADAVIVKNSSGGNALNVDGKLAVGGTANFNGPVNCNDGLGCTVDPLVVQEIEAEDPGGGAVLTLNTERILSAGDFILNGTSLGSGTGFNYNSTGHGNGASIDYYIGGTLEGYIDSTSFNNA